MTAVTPPPVSQLLLVSGCTYKHSATSANDPSAYDGVSIFPGEGRVNIKWPRSDAYTEPPKRQEPESGLPSGSMGRNWVQLAADIGRARDSLTIPIRRYLFGEARRVAPVFFADHSCSHPTVTVMPATVLATFPAAMQARTVISTNDDAVRIGSGRGGNDGRKSQSYSKNDFFHWALPRVIGPRLNDCLVFGFHQKTHLGLQSEETPDHRRTCGQPLWKPGRQ